MDQLKTGAFIAQMRKAQGLTQRELAEIIGVSDKTVSKWERGSGMPEISLMQPLCHALGTDLNELFSGRKLSGEDYRGQANANLMSLIQMADHARLNIVGAESMGEVRKASPSETHSINMEFWNDAGHELLTPITLPQWGRFLPDEDRLNLLGNLTGKRVLEIGCGRGGSLEYVWNKGASEIWGLDISSNQLARAKEYLHARPIPARLVCAPMESPVCIPQNYFDTVYSVFGVGWTSNIDKTFSAINVSLKPGGSFVFSWSHPIHKCTSMENGSIRVVNSYFDETEYSAVIDNRSIILANRMLSTWINALVRNGFAVEKLIEASSDDDISPENDAFAAKSRLVPAAFALKGRKL